MNDGKHRFLIAILTCSMLLASGAARALTVEEFYRGKTIDLVIGYSPGATYDLYARTVARHLSKYIPGNPRIVPRNLTGAGSRTAVNYVYQVGSQDGTVMGTADQSLAVEQAMGDKKLLVDVNKLFWIGNPIVSNNTTVSWHTSGVRSIEDVKVREVSVGATGASTSSQYPMAMNALLGTKFKIILGYPGASDINLAMERGEVAAKGSDSWAAWKATRPEWLSSKKINILVQIGLTPSPELPGVPLLIDLAKTTDDRSVLKLLSSSVVIGRPLFVGPSVPLDRVEALRSAFDQTMEDMEFQADAKSLKLDLMPVKGVEIQSLIREISGTSSTVSSRLREIIGGVE